MIWLRDSVSIRCPFVSIYSIAERIMKIRIFAVLAVTAVIISAFSGCFVTTGIEELFATEAPQIISGDEEYEGYVRVDKSAVELAPAEDYERVELTKGYESLDNENERQCYELVKKHIFYISATSESGTYHALPITMEGVKLTEVQIRKVLAAFTLDYPEIFWTKNSFEYLSSDDKTIVKLLSFLSGKEVEACLRLLRDKAEAVLSGLPTALSEYDREVYIHNAVAELCEYDNSTKDVNDSFKSFTSYGVLCENIAVCEGYSRAFQLLLSLSGVESYCVTGIGEEELHMWNAVSIDGNWYNTDITWDDDENYGVDFGNFNLSDEVFLEKHTPSPYIDELTEAEICGAGGGVPASFNLFIPDCNDNSMTYYKQKGVTVDGSDSENSQRITRRLVDTVEANYGADTVSVYLYIDEDYLDFTETKDNLFFSGDYLMFSCIDDANYILEGVDIDEDDVSFMAYPELSSITVFLDLTY
ncbi:MAG: transglutaminase domain-containing protein [Ruminococcus sp.]